MDEPTNHLDLNAVIWLTNYLTNWKKTLLVVSHNQEFLNNVCTDILHLEKLQINHYKGDYFKFTKILKQNNKKNQKEWNKFEKKINAMKKKISQKIHTQKIQTKKIPTKSSKIHTALVKGGSII